MKKVIFFVLLSSPVMFNSYSQISEFDLQNSIYKKAKSYNDPSVAINSLYKMIAIQPENVLLKDSLMREYLTISQWAPSYMISREILALQPNNLFALEVSCISLQNLGLKQQALNEYESLYLKSDRIDVLYTISFLQFELKNFTESLTNLDILINNSETEEMSVSVSKSDNSVQEVLIRAQLNYLKGLIYLEQSKNEDAKKYFSLEYSLYQSKSEGDGFVLKINKFKKL